MLLVVSGDQQQQQQRRVRGQSTRESFARSCWLWALPPEWPVLVDESMETKQPHNNESEVAYGVGWLAKVGKWAQQRVHNQWPKSPGGTTRGQLEKKWTKLQQPKLNQIRWIWSTLPQIITHCTAAAVVSPKFLGAVIVWKVSDRIHNDNLIDSLQTSGWTGPPCPTASLLEPAVKESGNGWWWSSNGKVQNQGAGLCVEYGGNLLLLLNAFGSNENVIIFVFLGGTIAQDASI